MKKTPARKRAAGVKASPVRRKKAGAVKAGGTGNAGRVGGIAVDPSDPSGNTIAIQPVKIS
jgi:hypothetical protein